MYDFLKVDSTVISNLLSLVDLQDSLVVLVWVGVLITCLANLQFGWVLSGLAIPGYLTALALFDKAIFFFTIAQGIATYLLTYFIARVFLKYLNLSEPFGRDRFFLILINSVVVRILSDVLVDTKFLGFDFLAKNLISEHINFGAGFGVLIVALIANYFWKPGLHKGLFSISVLTGITTLISSFVLVDLLGYSISNSIQFFFANSGSTANSGSIYIIILTVALFASQMNLIYGWEYNGILLPALIAVELVHPLAVLSCIGEAIIILYSVRVFLTFPKIQDIEFEGSRKIALFSTFGIIAKVIVQTLLGFLELRYLGEALGGFGFLVATLLAIKIHEKKIGLRLSLSTASVAGGGFVLATAVIILLAPLSRFQNINEKSLVNSNLTVNEITSDFILTKTESFILIKNKNKLLKFDCSFLVDNVENIDSVNTAIRFLKNGACSQLVISSNKSSYIELKEAINNKYVVLINKELSDENSIEVSGSSKDSEFLKKNSILVNDRRVRVDNDSLKQVRARFNFQQMARINSNKALVSDRNSENIHIFDRSNLIKFIAKNLEYNPYKNFKTLSKLDIKIAWDILNKFKNFKKVYTSDSTWLNLLFAINIQELKNLKGKIFYLNDGARNCHIFYNKDEDLRYKRRTILRAKAKGLREKYFFLNLFQRSRSTYLIFDNYNPAKFNFCKIALEKILDSEPNQEINIVNLKTHSDYESIKPALVSSNGTMNNLNCSKFKEINSNIASDIKSFTGFSCPENNTEIKKVSPDSSKIAKINMQRENSNFSVISFNSSLINTSYVRGGLGEQ